MTQPKKLGRPKANRYPVQTRVNEATHEALKTFPNITRQVELILTCYCESFAVRDEVERWLKLKG